MSKPQAFSPALIGQTEKAMNAILDRQLDGTGLTEPQWVTLKLIVTSGGSVAHAQLVERLVATQKVTDAHAQAVVGELIDARLVAAADVEPAQVSVTDAGRKLHRGIAEAVVAITGRLWGDLPTDDLAVAGRVLTAVLERANAELADG